MDPKLTTAVGDPAAGNMRARKFLIVVRRV